MRIGYARVSTQDQYPALQLDALQAALDNARPGDMLVVWKLDRLARSLKQLIERIELLAVREIGFHSLTEAIETTTAGGGWCSTFSPVWPSLNAPSSANARGPGWMPHAPAGPDGARSERCQGDAGGSQPLRNRCPFSPASHVL